jgi:hypothetical protein
VRTGTIDIDLGHHRKTHAVVELAKRSNLIVAALVLRAKLVARKAQHHQALGSVLLVQRLQAGELRRETASAGRVDDQERPTLELVQAHALAVDL